MERSKALLAAMKYIADAETTYARQNKSFTERLMLAEVHALVAIADALEQQQEES